MIIWKLFTILNINFFISYIIWIILGTFPKAKRFLKYSEEQINGTWIQLLLIYLGLFGLLTYIIISYSIMRKNEKIRMITELKK